MNPPPPPKKNKTKKQKSYTVGLFHNPIENNCRKRLELSV